MSSKSSDGSDDESGSKSRGGSKESKDSGESSQPSGKKAASPKGGSPKGRQSVADDELAKIKQDNPDGDEDGDDEQLELIGEDEESYYDEDEESEDDDELFQADETDDPDEDQSQGSDEKDHDTVSDVSIPSFMSDEFDPHKPDVQYAQVIPEPPWTGFLGPLFRLGVACLLPLLLAILVIYATFKGIKITIQVMMDLWVLFRQICVLMLKCLVSPFYILWKVAAPRFLQQSLWEAYQQRIGRHIDRLLHQKKRFEDMIADLPNVALACGLAATETCVQPLRRHSGKCFWYYFGRHIDEWILKPMQAAHINRTHAKKRKRAQDAVLKDSAAKEMMKRTAPKRARAKARAQREKARRMRAKKKRAQLEIKLNLPADYAGHEGVHKVQLEERTRGQMISRTMIIERRYAVAVGCIWFIAGGTLLVIIVDGFDDDSCVICEDQEETGMRVCRHGLGRACAFQLHEDKIIASIGIMALGLLILVYSIFLYRPSNKKDKKEEERKKLEAELIEKMGQMHKVKDEEVEAVEFLLEQRAKRTPARMMRKAWRQTPCSACLSSISFCMNGPLMCLFAYESSHRIRERSIVLQEVLYFLAYGWLSRIWECIQKRRGAVTPRKDKSKGADGQPSRRSILGAAMGCMARCGRWFLSTRLGQQVGRCFGAAAESKAGQAVSEAIASSPRAQRALQRLGIQSPAASQADSATARSIASSSRRAAGGVSETLEETLRRFGLLEEERHEEAVHEHHEKARGDAHGRLGIEESQLESGAVEGDIGVVEQEPDLHMLFEEVVNEEVPEFESSDEEGDGATARTGTARDGGSARTGTGTNPGTASAMTGSESSQRDMSAVQRKMSSLGSSEALGFDDGGSQGSG